MVERWACGCWGGVGGWNSGDHVGGRLDRGTNQQDPN